MLMCSRRRSFDSSRNPRQQTSMVRLAKKIVGNGKVLSIC